jgi:type I restriction enzyme S subunit
MSWKSVKIPEVLFFQEGPGVRNTQFTTSGVKLLNVGNINFGDLNLDATKVFISEQEAFGKYKHFLVEDGDLLIASSGIVVDNFHNKITWAKKEHLPLCLNTSTIRFRTLDQNILDIKYFSYFLKTRLFADQLSKLITGSAQLNFGPSHLKQISLPLPPLSTQKRIAEILDAADALRRKDQELLKKYDELAQAIFIDMFGDPVKNEKGWEVKTLEDVCFKITDGTHDTPERLTEGVKFITGKHIRPYFIDYENSDYVTAEIHAEIYRRCNPEFGDVLYTNIGVNYATAAMNTVHYEFSMKNVALLKYNRESLTGRFLEYQLNNDYFKDRLKTITGIGGAQQFLSLAQIKSIKLIVPSLKQQIIFEEKINTLFTSFFKQKDSIRFSNTLFNSLIQKAFKGELVS